MSQAENRHITNITNKNCFICLSFSVLPEKRLSESKSDNPHFIGRSRQLIGEPYEMIVFEKRFRV
jgi:hypothetical protein